MLQKQNDLHCISRAAILLCAVVVVMGLRPAQAGTLGAMFGYSEVKQQNMNAFPQWQHVIKEQTANSFKESDCDEGKPSATCLEKGWHDFLVRLKDKSAAEQLDAVNAYVNAQNYVGDKKNYGKEDHWADPVTFLKNGGDCEDFAILKYFSLRALGWPDDALRVVVVQDTRLRQPHAVLAVATEKDVLILDNQKKKIVSEDAISNYAPVYSLTDKQWWLHMPQSMLIADNG